MPAQVIKNCSLKPYNTFGIEATAEQLMSFNATEELINFIKNTELPDKIFILGGGSNVLFTADYDGLIIHPLNKGIKILEETDACAVVEVEAGEVWDDFVLWAVEHKLYGVENLSGIPGSVGAVPVQNIGAYGDEVRNVIKLVKGVEISTGNAVSYLNFECRFGYRDSIFKNELKNKIIITSVVFSLSKIKNLNLKYADLANYFGSNTDSELQEVRDAVCKIRDSKLPDYKLTGNAGSFFKNPVVLKSELEGLLNKFPDIRYFDYTSNHVKLAAGWLIDKCGLKGFRQGRAGVHEKQALVLINIGGAEGREILRLADLVRQKVMDKFGVELEYEVNILP
ncbi:MAG: UDP-N-acetylmuramate dehydrogenase [Bacteroidales bacterium]|nr:UDP-N-acetylmuramate dehydrogenase [Bacteroidales bacterium]HOY39678.1 UDP-N-acetylmuramate dehydrogenase [Bacteroidales bacterium]HQN94247.1 UDP-N-acetylmuramate dehydrogenase [Prolixibacteraceae bacterium]